MTPKPSRSSGNVLFLILIAVALFAALSYAVTNSTRNSGNSSAETSRIVASQILQFGSSFEVAITRSRVIDGTPEWGFDLSGTSTESTTNATCSSTSCKLFMGNGGGISVFRLPIEVSATPNPRFYVIGVQDIGTTEPDLVINYRGATKEVCEAYNKLLGLTNVDITSTALGFAGSPQYTGTLTSFPTTSVIINSNPVYTNIWGQKAFCARHASSEYNLFYTVMER